MWVAAYLVRNIKEISFFFGPEDEPAKNHLLFWKLPVLKIQDQPCLKTNIKYNIRPTKKSFKFCHSPFPLKYVIVLSNIAIFGYCVSWGS